MKNFCIAPFVNLAFTTNGPVQTCGRNYTHFGNTNENKPIEIWNSEKYKEVRKTFLQEERHASCSECWKIDDVGGRSQRIVYNERWMHLWDHVLVSADGEVLSSPFSVELILSNLCNLSCRMCFPLVSTGVSTTWKKAGIETSLIHWENKGHVKSSSIENIIEFFSNLDQDNFYELSIGGGEPLMERNLLKVLQHVPRTATLRILSNASKPEFITDEFLSLLQEFKHVTWKLSVDGPPKVNEYIRVGLDTKQYEDTIRRMKSVSGDIVMQTAYTLFNALRWKETLTYVESFGPARFVSSYGSHQVNPRLLPNDLRDLAVRNVQEWIDANSHRTDELGKDMLGSSINILGIMKQEWKNEWWNSEYTYEETMRRVKEYIGRLDALHQTNIFELIPEYTHWINSYD